MAWKITLDGKSINLDDLPLDVVNAAAIRADVNWLSLLRFPILIPVGLRELVTEVAKVLEVDPPDLTSAKNMLTFCESDAIVEIDEDLPTLFVDGDPKAEDGQETPGSSTRSTGASTRSR